MKYRPCQRGQHGTESPPVRGAWIEIPAPSGGPLWPLSPPVRGAWIEIGLLNAYERRCWVAPREGGVD